MTTLEPNELMLGRKAEAASTPLLARLDTVRNPTYTKAGDWHPYVARFTVPEMTSLCPVTGQPDFATLIIDYVPYEAIVESKSLKLFIQSFRNHPAFHEECTAYIAERLRAALKPVWLRVAAYWNPRGGIPIDVFVQHGNVPDDVHIPALPDMTFRGR